MAMKFIKPREDDNAVCGHLGDHPLSGQNDGDAFEDHKPPGVVNINMYDQWIHAAEDINGGRLPSYSCAFEAFCEGQSPVQFLSTLNSQGGEQ